MIYTFTASADIEQLNVVKLTGALEVAPATAGSDTIIGVALQSASNGENVPVKLIAEILHGYAGASVSAGDKLSVDANGNVVPETTAGNPFDFIAITDASTNEEVEMLPIKGTV